VAKRNNGARAIVTGHSRGLGAAVAEELVSRKVPVLGISRTRNAQMGTRNALREVELDLSNTAALSQWIASDALRMFLGDPGMAILVNNAGLLQPIGPLQTQDAVAVGRAVAVNVGAALMLSAAMVQASTHVSDRRILHISSGAGRQAYAGWAVYCASKAALDHHARAVALDSTRGMRISSVAPGVIDTDMQSEIRASTIDKFPQKERFDALKRNGQLRDPRDVARRLVDHLLSDKFGEDTVTELY
jgi:benzil reductase ((S)-benzoin forming)